MDIKQQRKTLLMYLTKRQHGLSPCGWKQGWSGNQACALALERLGGLAAEW